MQNELKIDSTDGKGQLGPSPLLDGRVNDPDYSAYNAAFQNWLDGQGGNVSQAEIEDWASRNGGHSRSDRNESVLIDLNLGKNKIVTDTGIYYLTDEELAAGNKEILFDNALTPEEHLKARLAKVNAEAAEISSPKGAFKVFGQIRNLISQVRDPVNNALTIGGRSIGRVVENVHNIASHINTEYLGDKLNFVEWWKNEGGREGALWLERKLAGGKSSGDRALEKIDNLILNSGLSDSQLTEVLELVGKGKMSLDDVGALTQIGGLDPKKLDKYFDDISNLGNSVTDVAANFIIEKVGANPKDTAVRKLYEEIKSQVATENKTPEEVTAEIKTRFDSATTALLQFGKTGIQAQNIIEALSSNNRETLTNFLHAHVHSIPYSDEDAKALLNSIESREPLDYLLLTKVLQNSARFNDQVLNDSEMSEVKRQKFAEYYKTTRVMELGGAMGSEFSVGKSFEVMSNLQITMGVTPSIFNYVGGQMLGLVGIQGMNVYSSIVTAETLLKSPDHVAKLDKMLRERIVRISDEAPVGADGLVEVKVKDFIAKIDKSKPIQEQIEAQFASHGLNINTPGFWELIRKDNQQLFVGKQWVNFNEFASGIGSVALAMTINGVVRQFGMYKELNTAFNEVIGKVDAKDSQGSFLAKVANMWSFGSGLVYTLETLGNVGGMIFTPSQTTQEFYEQGMDPSQILVNPENNAVRYVDPDDTSENPQEYIYEPGGATGQGILYALIDIDGDGILDQVPVSGVELNSLIVSVPTEDSIVTAVITNEESENTDPLTQKEIGLFKTQQENEDKGTETSERRATREGDADDAEKRRAERRGDDESSTFVSENNNTREWININGTNRVLNAVLDENGEAYGNYYADDNSVEGNEDAGEFTVANGEELQLVYGRVIADEPPVLYGVIGQDGVIHELTNIDSDLNDNIDIYSYTDPDTNEVYELYFADGQLVRVEDDEDNVTWYNTEAESQDTADANLVSQSNPSPSSDGTTPTVTAQTFSIDQTALNNWVAEPGETGEAERSEIANNVTETIDWLTGGDGRIDEADLERVQQFKEAMGIPADEDILEKDILRFAMAVEHSPLTADGNWDVYEMVFNAMGPNEIRQVLITAQESRPDLFGENLPYSGILEFIDTGAAGSIAVSGETNDDTNTQDDSQQGDTDAQELELQATEESNPAILEFNSEFAINIPNLDEDSVRIDPANPEVILFEDNLGNSFRAIENERGELVVLSENYGDSYAILQDGTREDLTLVYVREEGMAVYADESNPAIGYLTDNNTADPVYLGFNDQRELSLIMSENDLGEYRVMNLNLVVISNNAIFDESTNEVFFIKDGAIWSIDRDTGLITVDPDGVVTINARDYSMQGDQLLPSPVTEEEGYQYLATDTSIPPDLNNASITVLQDSDDYSVNQLPDPNEDQINSYFITDNSTHIVYRFNDSDGDGIIDFDTGEISILGKDISDRSESYIDNLIITTTQYGDGSYQVIYPGGGAAGLYNPDNDTITLDNISTTHSVLLDLNTTQPELIILKSNGGSYRIDSALEVPPEYYDALLDGIIIIENSENIVVRSEQSGRILVFDVNESNEITYNEDDFRYVNSGEQIYIYEIDDNTEVGISQIQTIDGQTITRYNFGGYNRVVEVNGEFFEYTGTIGLNVVDENIDGITLIRSVGTSAIYLVNEPMRELELIPYDNWIERGLTFDEETNLVTVTDEQALLGLAEATPLAIEPTEASTPTPETSLERISIPADLGNNLGLTFIDLDPSDPDIDIEIRRIEQEDGSSIITTVDYETIGAESTSGQIFWNTGLFTSDGFIVYADVSNPNFGVTFTGINTPIDQQNEYADRIVRDPNGSLFLYERIVINNQVVYVAPEGYTNESFILDFEGNSVVGGYTEEGEPFLYIDDQNTIRVFEDGDLEDASGRDNYVLVTGENGERIIFDPTSNTFIELDSAIPIASDFLVQDLAGQIDYIFQRGSATITVVTEDYNGTINILTEVDSIPVENRILTDNNNGTFTLSIGSYYSLILEDTDGDNDLNITSLVASDGRVIPITETLSAFDGILWGMGIFRQTEFTTGGTPLQITGIVQPPDMIGNSGFIDFGIADNPTPEQTPEATEEAEETPEATPAAEATEENQALSEFNTSFASNISGLDPSTIQVDPTIPNVIFFGTYDGLNFKAVEADNNSLLVAQDFSDEFYILDAEGIRQDLDVEHTDSDSIILSYENNPSLGILLNNDNTVETIWLARNDSGDPVFFVEYDEASSQYIVRDIVNQTSVYQSPLVDAENGIMYFISDDHIYSYDLSTGIATLDPDNRITVEGVDYIAGIDRIEEAPPRLTSTERLLNLAETSNLLDINETTIRVDESDPNLIFFSDGEGGEYKAIVNDIEMIIIDIDTPEDSYIFSANGIRNDLDLINTTAESQIFTQGSSSAIIVNSENNISYANIITNQLGEPLFLRMADPTQGIVDLNLESVYSTPITDLDRNTYFISNGIIYVYSSTNIAYPHPDNTILINGETYGIVNNELVPVSSVQEEAAPEQTPEATEEEAETEVQDIEGDLEDYVSLDETNVNSNRNNNISIILNGEGYSISNEHLYNDQNEYVGNVYRDEDTTLYFIIEEDNFEVFTSSGTNLNARLGANENEIYLNEQPFIIQDDTLYAVKNVDGQTYYVDNSYHDWAGNGWSFPIGEQRYIVEGTNVYVIGEDNYAHRNNDLIFFDFEQGAGDNAGFWGARNDDKLIVLDGEGGGQAYNINDGTSSAITVTVSDSEDIPRFILLDNKIYGFDEIEYSYSQVGADPAVVDARSVTHEGATYIIIGTEIYLDDRYLGADSTLRTELNKDLYDLNASGQIILQDTQGAPSDLGETPEDTDEQQDLAQPTEAQPATLAPTEAPGETPTETENPSETPTEQPSETELPTSTTTSTATSTSTATTTTTQTATPEIRFLDTNDDDVIDEYDLIEVGDNNYYVTKNSAGEIIIYNFTDDQIDNEVDIVTAINNGTVQPQENENLIIEVSGDNGEFYIIGDTVLDSSMQEIGGAYQLDTDDIPGVDLHVVEINGEIFSYDQDNQLDPIESNLDNESLGNNPSQYNGYVSGYVVLNGEMYIEEGSSVGFFRNIDGLKVFTDSRDSNTVRIVTENGLSMELIEGGQFTYNNKTYTIDLETQVIEELQPTDVPTNTSTATSTSTVTATSTQAATVTSTERPTETASPEPSETATNTPSPTPSETATQTATNTMAPTNTLSPSPTQEVIARATEAVTSTLAATETEQPTNVPSEIPTETEAPTEIPTIEPTENPVTEEPTIEPTLEMEGTETEIVPFTLPDGFTHPLVFDADEFANDPTGEPSLTFTGSPINITTYRENLIAWGVDGTFLSDLNYVGGANINRILDERGRSYGSTAFDENLNVRYILYRDNNLDGNFDINNLLPTRASYLYGIEEPTQAFVYQSLADIFKTNPEVFGLQDGEVQVFLDDLQSDGKDEEQEGNLRAYAEALQTYIIWDVDQNDGQNHDLAGENSYGYYYNGTYYEPENIDQMMTDARMDFEVETEIFFTDENRDGSTNDEFVQFLLGMRSTIGQDGNSYMVTDFEIEGLINNFGLIKYDSNNVQVIDINQGDPRPIRLYEEEQTFVDNPTEIDTLQDINTVVTSIQTDILNSVNFANTEEAKARYANQTQDQLISNTVALDLATISGVQTLLTDERFEDLREAFPIRSANDFRDLVILITLTQDFDFRLRNAEIATDSSGEYFILGTGREDEFDPFTANMQVQTVAYLWDTAVDNTVRDNRLNPLYVNSNGELTDEGIILASLELAEYTNSFRLVNDDIVNLSDEGLGASFITNANNYFTNVDFEPLRNLVLQEYEQGDFVPTDYDSIFTNDPLFGYADALYHGRAVEYDPRIYNIEPILRGTDIVGYDLYIAADTRDVLSNNPNYRYIDPLNYTLTGNDYLTRRRRRLNDYTSSIPFTDFGEPIPDNINN